MSPATTPLADLNELWTGYQLNRETWWCADIEATWNEKLASARASCDAQEITHYIERGRAQAECLRHEWVMNMGEPLNVTAVEWVAHGGIKSIVSDASPNHPADLLIEIKKKYWLGISCKSRKGAEGSGLKNPGLSTIEKFTGYPLGLQTMVDRVVESVLPNTTLKQRKERIRAEPTLQKQTRDIGRQLQVQIRDAVLIPLQGTDKYFLWEFVHKITDNDWKIHPKYVRIVGTGTSANTYSATLYDPSREVGAPGDLSVVPVGEVSIGFKSGRNRLYLLRVKWESEPLGSTLKFSVDKWEN